MKRFAAALFLAAAATAAQASDGTIDVNITSATTFTISAPGSYRVVDDVTMTAGLSAIIVNAPDVIIDLGGHTLTGQGGAASGGIVKGAAAQAGARVTIANGQVRGFSREGIQLADNATIKDMIIVNNGSWGADVGPNSVVKQSKLLGNSNAVTSGGVRLGADSVIESCVIGGMTLAADTTGISMGVGCSALNNSISSLTGSVAAVASGILAGDRATVTGNTITGLSAPQVYGINAANSASIRNNNVTNIAATGATGAGYGIDVNDGSLVEGNICSENTAGGNSVGIRANSGCTIRGNTCYRNRSLTSGSGYGIWTGATCTIEGNTCVGQQESPSANLNAYGIQTSSSRVVNNHCSQNTALVQGVGIGISAGNDSLVQGNRCEGNAGAGGSFGWGILVDSNNLVANNSTANNTSSGIDLGGSGNRCEANRSTEAPPAVTNGGDDSVGAGDYVNLAF